jgi:hypothetical protein
LILIASPLQNVWVKVFCRLIASEVEISEANFVDSSLKTRGKQMVASL